MGEILYMMARAGCATARRRLFKEVRALCTATGQTPSCLCDEEAFDRLFTGLYAERLALAYASGKLVGCGVLTFEKNLGTKTTIDSLVFLDEFRKHKVADGLRALLKERIKRYLSPVA